MNCYYCSIQLCVFLSAEWKLERASEGMLGWYSVTVISIQLCVFLSTEWKGGSERECWGGIVTVISIQLCVFFCQPSESRMV